MADLIVDETLDDTSRDLRSIKDEFANASKDADHNASIWGQRDVSRAMDEFADNWRVHRDKIQERLSALSDRIERTVATWSDADQQLAAGLEAEVSGA